MCNAKARCRAWLPGLLALVLAGPAAGQIYKYQDEKGKWHFTDKPPATVENAEMIGKGATRGSTAAQGNLAERLNERFDPKSAIEEATLAVVTVKTPIGNGSGFFVTGDGFLLTNRHVVRPEETGQWQQASGRLEEAEEEFKRADEVLARQGAALSKMRRARNDLESQVRLESSGSRRVRLERQLAELNQRYKARNNRYREVKKDVDRKRRAFEKVRSEFSRRGAATTLATNFTLILKDKSKVQARLVGLSERSDLALLKVDGFETPRLEMAGLGNVSQGMKVFAVGSPLGLADAMTAGVVTRVRGDHIMTDAKILPGNSGGPLINEDGQVIGINTLKLARSVEAEGFGVAIPVKVASEQFPQIGEH
jgi:S1-C subfamily serine protease